MISFLINLMYGGENYDNFAIFISTKRSAAEGLRGFVLTAQHNIEFLLVHGKLYDRAKKM